MQNIISKMTVLLLLIQFVTTIFAQERISILAHKPDTVILRDGNINYLRTSGISVGINYPERVLTTIERVETKDLRGKTFEYFDFKRPYNDAENKFIMEMYRSLFSRERAKQLENMSISCIIIISPAENSRILHIRFHLSGTDNEKFPLKFSELNELEQRIRREPKLIKEFNGDGKIVDGGEGWGLSLEFKSLYK